MKSAVRIGFCLFVTCLWSHAARAEPQVTKAPALLQFVEAEIPAGADLSVPKAVVLSIDIDEAGKVSEASILESAGDAFDQAALKAVLAFVFSGAEIDGKPAPVRITYRYEFVAKTQMVPVEPQVNFEGVVLDRYSKKPVAGVKVRITPLELATTSDAIGAFSFVDVAEGTYMVELSGDNLLTVSTQETLSKDKKLRVKYLVEQKPAADEGVDEEVVVRAPRIKKEAVEVAIKTEEARLVPGTQGDTLKVVQNLPGVARSAFGSGQLVVWGAAPKETRTFIEGIEVPALYHIGGVRSVLPSDMVKSIELLPGAYGPRYGRGLGGIITVDMADLPREGVHGFVGGDILDAGAMLTVAATPRLRVGLAGRLSYLDRLATTFVEEDVGDFFPIPVYRDAQLLINADLRDQEKVAVALIGSSDTLERVVPSSDPAQRRAEDTSRSFARLLATYERLLADGSSVQLNLGAGPDHDRVQSDFGQVSTAAERKGWRNSLRATYRRSLAQDLTLTLGFDGQHNPNRHRRQGTLSLPPREGDISVFGQPPGDGVATDTWRATVSQLGVFASLEWRWGRWQFAPGLRGEAYALSGSRLTPKIGATPTLGYSRLYWLGEPRAAVSFALTDSVELRAAAGIYHQAPETDDLSAVFGTPTLEPSRAWHAMAGAAVELPASTSVEAAGFYRSLRDLTVRSDQVSPRLAEVLTQEGEGRAYGGQVLVRRRLSDAFFGWLSYALTRSERLDHPLSPTASWRPFDFDQTHVFTAVASYALGPWTVGGKFRLASGMPRTPVVDSYYNARDDRFEPLFGKHNSERIPRFYQLDARLEREISLGKSLKARAFVDAQNLTARKNPEEVTYSFDYSEKSYITGLPFLAVAGARLEF